MFVFRAESEQIHPVSCRQHQGSTQSTAYNWYGSHQLFVLLFIAFVECMLLMCKYGPLNPNLWYEKRLSRFRAHFKTGLGFISWFNYLYTLLAFCKWCHHMTLHRCEPSLVLSVLKFIRGNSSRIPVVIVWIVWLHLLLLFVILTSHVAPGLNLCDLWCLS